MTIKEVEEQTGLARSNIRFYEKERLVEPARNEANGYRDYSEKDIEDIKKIAYLRTLGITIDDIRSIISGSLLSYRQLPPQIPIQWSEGEASSLINKSFIFVYPVLCIAVHLWLKPCIRAKLGTGSPYNSLITEYLTNYICFVSLSVEVFTILFVHGVMKNVVAVLLVDT
ncbi:MAG: MerR family transcriptional regulator, partial [Lachnospiraceae bacterium]|nr:MerR family transcriptional regulator [Lachnospiraceae bacterium]